MPHIGFHKVLMCVLFKFFHHKQGGYLLPSNVLPNIEKKLDDIEYAFWVENTWRTLDLCSFVLIWMCLWKILKKTQNNANFY
jgi:hypothetical protein